MAWVCGRGERMWIAVGMAQNLVIDGQSSQDMLDFLAELHRWRHVAPAPGLECGAHTGDRARVRLPGPGVV